MRSMSPLSLISSTSTKEEVWGGSVGGRVSQTRGVTFSAPNCTVWLIGISRCEIRPVTLSRAANTAISFWIFSAWASELLPSIAAAATHRSPARLTRDNDDCLMPHNPLSLPV